MNDSMTEIHKMIGMTGIPGDQDGKGDYDEPAISRITGLTDRDDQDYAYPLLDTPCQSQNKVSYQFRRLKKTFDTLNP